MVEKGQPWERPTSEPPAWHVEGDDAALAAAVREQPGARVGFRPDASSDLARALGIHASGFRGGGFQGAGFHGGGASLELGIDALQITARDRELFAVNMVVVGTAPDRTGWFTGSPDLRVEVDGRLIHEGPATTVVIANGQYLRGHDVVPRGHPGDGRAEIQVYAVPRGQRAGVRSRLPQGVHLPHPGITQTTGRRIDVVVGPSSTGRPVGLEVDGVPAPGATAVTVEVAPEAFLIVV